MSSPSQFKHASIVDSFRTAGKGLIAAFRREPSLRWQFCGGLVAFLLALLLGLPVWKIMFIVIVAVQVIACELVNTVFEAITDIIHPDFHVAVGYAKDVMAAAVLVVSVGALIIGLWLFIPPIVRLFS